MRIVDAGMRILLVLVNAVTLASFAIADQPAAMRFARISLEDGLSQSTVEAIIQDRRGFLWFGTNDGLNRYDGFEFEIYRNDPADTTSISDNYIYSMCEDRDGFLWIATNNGLNRFDPVEEVFTRYMNDPADASSLSHNVVHTVCLDAWGNLWAGTVGGGLNRFDHSTGRFARFLHDPDDIHSIRENMVTALASGPDTTLWVGTFHGMLQHVDLRENDGGRLVFHEIPVSLSPGAENIVWSILPEDTITWIGTSRDGLVRVHARTGSVTRFRPGQQPAAISGNSIHDMFRDRTGVLWVGTESEGLNRMDPATGMFTVYRYDPLNPRSLGDNSVWAIYEDRQGILWIGTEFGGISKLDLHRMNFEHHVRDPRIAGSLSNNLIWCFREDARGTIWVGTDGGGLNAFDPRTREFQTFRHEPKRPASLGHDIVTAIEEDEHGRLVIGTNGGGINIFHPGTGTFVRFVHDARDARTISNNSVRAVLRSRDGTFRVGSYGGGVDRFDPGDGTVTRLAIAGETDHPRFVSCLMEDPSGDLWVGTFGEGLVIYGAGAKVSKRYVHTPADTTSLPNNKVYSLLLDSKRRIWVGTASGLALFDQPSSSFTTYTTRHGLPNNVVYAILEDGQGALWLTTNRGLCRFTPDLRRGVHFTPKDGLQAYEFNRGAALKLRDGRMLVGGINGFNMFDPSDFEIRSSPSPVVITEFKVGNEERRIGRILETGGAIVLPHSTNEFSFSFGVLDFRSGDRHQFAYLMEGATTDWIETEGRRYASFAGLPPGEYVFRVGVSDAGGIPPGTTDVAIVITPPFWGTWWFRIAGILSVVSLIAFVYRRKVASLRHERAVQEETSRRLIQLQESERKRIASGLHDSLGQNLLVLKNSLQQTSTDPNVDSDVRRELHALSEIAQQSLDEVREISFDLHPHVLDRLGLRKAIETVVDKLSQRSSLVIITQFTGVPERFTGSLEIGVYRIAQEALSNIVKHSGAMEARISLAVADGTLHMEIADNGRGFDADAHKSRKPEQWSLGLLNIAEWVRSLRGTYSIESAPGRGTSIMVHIPFNSDEHERR